MIAPRPRLRLGTLAVLAAAFALACASGRGVTAGDDARLYTPEEYARQVAQDSVRKEREDAARAAAAKKSADERAAREAAQRSADSAKAVLRHQADSLKAVRKAADDSANAVKRAQRAEKAHADSVAKGLVTKLKPAEIAPPRQTEPVARPLFPEPKPESTLVAKKPASEEESPEKRRHITVKGEQRKITVSFDGTPIQDVTAVFATHSGRSILLGEGAIKDKKITADIREQPWNIALEDLLAANGLEVQENETGMLLVRGQKEAREYEQSERPRPVMIRISYGEAANMATEIKAILGEKTQISALKDNNSLLVSGSKETIEEVKELVKQMDIHPPTVRIAARIISINKSQMAAMGFQYTIEDPTKPFNPSAGGLSGTTGDATVQVQPSGILTNKPPLLLNRSKDSALSTFLTAALKGTPYTLTSFVDFLQGYSLARTDASPVVTTTSEKAASIEVGEAYYVPTMVSNQGMNYTQGQNTSGMQGSSGASGNGMNSNVTSGMNTIRVGISLQVTPSVTPNGKIKLKIMAKRSGGQIGASGMVTESFQSGQTEMIVSEGQTAVIGGLTLEEHSKGVTGVPVLMHLPVIGKFFSTTNQSTDQRDVIILVTPTILHDPDDGLPMPTTRSH